MRESALIRKDLFVIMYDKSLYKVVDTPYKDPNTGHVKSVNNVEFEFGCNVQNTSGQIMLKEFGKEYDAEYRISCAKEVNITEKDYIFKDEYLYRIVAFTETEQSKIFLIKRDESLDASTVLVDLEIIKGKLVAKSYKNNLDKLEITEEGVLEANGKSEGISEITDNGNLIVDTLKITELLDD